MFTAHAGTSTVELECPHCQYDLSGTASAWQTRDIDSGPCPECGQIVSLTDLSLLDRPPPPWLFESSARSPLAAFASTSLGLLLPWRFWSQVRASQRRAPGRLLLFAAIWGAMATAAASATILLYDPPFNAHPVSFAAPSGLCILIWLLPAWSVVLISPYPLSSRLGRLLSPFRPACYSFLIPGLMMPTALIAATGLDMLVGVQSAAGPIAAAGLASLLLGAVYWWCVIRRYLQIAYPVRFFCYVGAMSAALLPMATVAYGFVLLLLALFTAAL